MKRFLVVADMQKDFVSGVLGTKEAAAIVPLVAQKITAFDGEIIALLDTHGADYLHTSEGKKLPVAHGICYTDGWTLCYEVAKALDGKPHILLEKSTFASLRLPELLLEAAQTEPFSVELCGVCTDIAVVSNALLLKTCFPEAAILVDAACCAGMTPDSHRAALTTMRMCQIDVTG